MRTRSLVSVMLAFMFLAVASPVFAQGAGADAANSGLVQWSIITAGFALAIAAAGGAIGQGRAIGSAAEAIARLSRSPHWVGTAMAPESKLLLTCDVGERTLAMAPCVVHQVAQA